MWCGVGLNIQSLNMEEQGGDGVMMVVRKAEIDTAPPFRSVKEAVSLFGDRVFAPPPSPASLNLNLHQSSRLGVVAAELEETRQNLQRATEQSLLMAHCLSSLQEELERTKQEIQQLKQRDSELEELKFVENSTEFEIKDSISHQQTREFQKKRYVAFVNPPSVPHNVMPPQTQSVEKLERQSSVRKNIKKPLISLVGALFSRKRGSQQGR